MPANCDVIVVSSQFLSNLQPSGSRILGAWSIKLIVSLIVTFSIKEAENETKVSLTQILNYWSKGTIYAKKCCFFCKPHADISKTMGVSVLKAIFLKLNMCVLLQQISSV